MLIKSDENRLMVSMMDKYNFIYILSDLIKLEGSYGVLLQINIDGFKVINQAFGLTGGDCFLREFSIYLEQQLRELSVASGFTCIVGKLGVDEFLVYLHKKDEVEGLALAEDLRQRIKRKEFLGGSVCATVSIGVVGYPNRCSSVKELLILSDLATQMAKQLGRDRVYLYKGGNNSAEGGVLAIFYESMNIRKQIKKAIETDRVEPWYQPIVDVSTGKVCQYEALARIVNIGGSMLSPCVFIPVAEQSGYIGDIDRIIIEKTLILHKQLLSFGKKVGMCINLSGRHFDDEAMLDYIREAVYAYKSAPELVTFEITETAMIKDFENAKRFVSNLRSYGCKFALDDFGSGVTSYSYLIKLDIDAIKIDKEFIQELPENGKSEVVVRSIQQLANDLGIETVAEYVDREEILMVLKGLGIRKAQGYLLGKPQGYKEVFESCKS